MTQYICKHFTIKELVSKQVFKDRGKKAWALLDIRALMTLDNLRIKYGPITINNWNIGGPNQSRGLRMPGTDYYSPYSQHSFGRAFDCIFKDTTAAEVRQDILANPTNFAFIHINSFEENTSWLHFDTRNENRILTFPIPLSTK